MTTQRLVASLREGASAVYSAIDETILSDIRANRLRIAGLRGESQVLTILSVCFVMVGIVLMILSPQIRQSYDLYSHTSDNYVNGTLIPLPTVAIIGFAVSLAWSLVLYACTSMAWWIRIVVTIIHGSLMLIWLLPLSGMMNSSIIICLIALLIVSVMTTRALAHESPWRWIGIFAAESVMLATSHWQYVDLLNQSGINMLLAGIALIMQQQSVLVVPMMFYVGINMTRAAMNFGQWGTISTTQVTLWQLTISTLFIIALRVWQIPNLRPPTTVELVVAGVYIVVVASTGYVVWRVSSLQLQGTLEKLLGTYAPWLVIVSMLPVILVTLMNFTIGGINLVTGASNPAIIAVWDQFTAISNSLTYGINYLITTGFALFTWVMWRRTQYTLAFYLWMVFCVRFITHALDYIHVPLRMNVADTLLYAVGVIILCIRMRHPSQRHTALGQLFALSITSYFMQQLDFLNNPFSPVFSYTGIFFVGFGFVWDTLVGAGWVNESSLRFPRHARLFGYLGYTLLTVTLVMWAGFSMNTDLLSLLSGKNAVEGVYAYGFPAVHLLYLLIIFAPTAAFTNHGESAPQAHGILAEQVQP